IADGGVRSVHEKDGTWLYSLRTVPTLGLAVVSGRHKDRAFAAARAVFKESLIVGAASLLALALLGLYFVRRLARPLRDLTQVVAAGTTDDDVHATPQGPSEVVALAERFNQLFDERRAR